MAAATTINPIVQNPAVTGGARTGNTGSRYYRPELDALRFFAFLAVFLHHGVYSLSPVFSRFGGFGLSLFFLLSAFLITELLQREKSRTGKVAIRDFYVRRALRIWPLYYAFVLLTVLIGWVFPHHRSPWMFVVSFLLMWGNFYVGGHGFPNSSAGFLWSISVEEQFYVFWPLANGIASVQVLKQIALWSIPVGCGAALLLTRLHNVTNLTLWANPIVEFQMFGWGVLLSLGLRHRLPRIGGAYRVLLGIWGILLWVVAAKWGPIDDARMPGAASIVLGYLLVGAGSALMFLSAYGLSTDQVPKVLAYLGRISYGLYVFHELALETTAWLLNRWAVTASAQHHAVFGAAHVVSALLLTVGVSMLSYRYFEAPFLRLKERFAVVRSRTV